MSNGRVRGSTGFHIKVLSLGVRAAEELDNAFSVILKERPGALLVLADRLFLHNRPRIMEFALKNRLPGVHAYVELVEAGGLMSYGPELYGHAQARGLLCGPDPEGYKARRPAGRAAGEVRASHQSQNRQADRISDSSQCAGESGPGDPMKTFESRVSGFEFINPKSRSEIRKFSFLRCVT